MIVRRAAAVVDDTRLNLMREVEAERMAQDAEWGGPRHDDGHAPDEWLSFIEKQVDHGNDCVGMDAEDNPDEQYRGRLLKIAALAFAAIESLDRFHAKER